MRLERYNVKIIVSDPCDSETKAEMTLPEVARDQLLKIPVISNVVETLEDFVIGGAEDGK